MLGPPLAVAVGAVLFAGGLGAYILNLSTNPAITELLSDTVALLTGRSLLQIARSAVGAVVAPAPVSDVVLRAPALVRHGDGGGGTALAYRPATDAGVVTTLLGVVGIAATIGFGTLDTLSTDEPADLTKRPDAMTDSDGTERADDDDNGIDAGRRAVLEQLAAIIVVPAALSRCRHSGQLLSYDDESEGQTVEAASSTPGSPSQSSGASVLAAGPLRGPEHLAGLLADRDVRPLHRRRLGQDRRHPRLRPAPAAHR